MSLCHINRAGPRSFLRPGLTSVNTVHRPVCPPFGRQVSTARAANSAPIPPSRPQAKQRCVSISGSGVKPQRESRGQRPLVPSAQDASRRGAGVQRTAPSGAVRIGRPPARGGSPEGSALWCRPHRTPPGEGRESRGQRPLVPSA